MALRGQPKGIGTFTKIFSELERVEYYTFYSPDGCWYWTGYLNAKGYGVIKCNGRAFLAHRVNFALLKGEIPKGLFLCHKCDNPACINPDHLFIGTAKDNAVDMVLKGRSYDRSNFKNPNVKLTEKQVLDIISYHKSGMKRGQIQYRVNVPINRIDDIIYKRSWKSLWMD